MYRHSVILLLIVADVLFHAPPVPGAEAEISTGLGFQTEYNDNIDDSPNHKRTDVITHIKPLLSARRESGRLNADVSYRGDYQFYVKGRNKDYAHYLKASALAEVVENLLFFSAAEDLQPIHTDLTRDEAYDDDSLRDMVNRNSFTVSPYFQLQPTDRTQASFGYRFSDMRYTMGASESRRNFFPGGGDDYAFNDKKSQQSTVFSQVSHEFTDRFSAYVATDVTRWKGDSKDFSRASSFYRYQIYAGGQYEISENLVASLAAGPSYMTPDEGDSRLSPYIQANVQYAFGRSTIGFSNRTSYMDDPSSGRSTRQETYQVWWEKGFDRTRVNLALSYNTFEDEAAVSDDTTGDRPDNTTNDSKNVWPTASVSYDLSSRLTWSTRYHANLYTDHSQGANRHTLNNGIRYQLDEDSWLGLSHRIEHAAPYSEPSYYSNKIMLDLYFGF